MADTAKDYPVVSCDGKTIVVEGNAAEHYYTYIGVPYTFRYRFSPPVLKDQTSSGASAAVTGGRMKVRRYFVNYSETGHLDSEMTPDGRSTFHKSVTHDPPKNGILSIPVIAGKFILDLVSRSAKPLAVQSASWEALFNLRSRRT